MGPTGATGATSTAIHGTFFSFLTGPYTPPSASGATTVIPTQIASAAPENTPGAFTVNSDGSVTVNNAGCYLITASVTLAPGNQGVFGIVVNRGGLASSYLDSFAASAILTTHTTQISRTAVICVDAQDIINIGLAASANPIVLLASPGGGTTIITPASTLTFVKLD